MNEPDADQTTSLRRANVGAAVLHAVQAFAVLALATDFALPVTASYLAGPPGTTPMDPGGALRHPHRARGRGFSWRSPRSRTSLSAPRGGSGTSLTWAVSATPHDGSSTRSPRR